MTIERLAFAVKMLAMFALGVWLADAGSVVERLLGWMVYGEAS
jgi:hypothetical protein